MTATTTGTDLPAPPVPQEFLDELVAEGWFTEAELQHALNTAPPLYATPPPDTAEHVEFDAGEVSKKLRQMRQLRHTKTRRWKGSPFVPAAWQIVWVIAPVFGWRYAGDHPDPELAGTRVIREVYIEIPRKNGKSTLVSALLLILLCADGEPSPEVYTAASDRDQASIILDGARQMALASPSLRKRIGVGNILGKLIRYPRNGGVMRALSKLAEAAHGLNVSGGAIDELHVHKTRDLVDAILSGTGARAQPLVFIVTTADEGREHSIYDEQHKQTVQLAEGAFVDHSRYGLIWSAPASADPMADATIARANPGAGATVTWAYLRSQRDKARNTPSYFPTYLRLHLNVRDSAATRLLPMGDWKAAPAIQLVDQRHLTAVPLWGGLDLSATSDFTAFVAVAGPASGEPMFDVIGRYWVPEERLKAIAQQCRVPLDTWRRQGWLRVTEGNTVDYGAIRSEIQSLRGQGYTFRRIGYDPWNANETTVQLQQDGFPMVEVRQGYASLSAPTKRLERLTLDHMIRHGGDPVLTWMASCLEVRRDDNGNMRPIKPEIDRAATRIDGMSALIMALFCWLRWGAGDRGRRRVRGRSVA